MLQRKKTKNKEKTRINKPMKKIILILSIIFVAVSTTVAQTPVTPTATVNLNVKLNAIQSITASASIVDLEYKTIEDYNTGVKSPQVDHLTVYSTGGFVVKVASDI
jgi:capsular polysaccharide biosynthesis protein